MEYSGHDIADTVRNVYLNRAGINDTAMLPVINDVYETLQQNLIEHGSPIFKTIFAPITLAVGATSFPYGTGDGTLPSDFVSPLALWEKSDGAENTQYVAMTEKDELPIVSAVDSLLYWSWNEEEIKFVGATSVRNVRISGYKMLPLLAEAKDKIKISFAKGYISARVAEQCALTISHNPTLASQIKLIADNKYTVMISRYVKKDQAFPVRRRGYRRLRRRI